MGGRGLRRQFGANRDRDSPHESERITNSPQFPGDNALVGPVPVQQQKHRPRKLTVSCIVLVNYVEDSFYLGFQSLVCVIVQPAPYYVQKYKSDQCKVISHSAYALHSLISEYIIKHFCR